jgi:hypothetical protein
MAVKTHRDIGVKIDNAAGTLTDISKWCNQGSLARAIDMLDTTGLGATTRNFYPGLGSVEITINGFINSTVDGIFGPLVSVNTSVLKTIQWQAYSTRFYNYEGWVSKYDTSGTRDSLETFSVTLVNGTTVINRTSVSLS